jgi:hypothetical protein
MTGSMVAVVGWPRPVTGPGPPQIPLWEIPRNRLDERVSFKLHGRSAIEATALTPLRISLPTRPRSNGPTPRRVQAGTEHDRMDQRSVQQRDPVGRDSGQTMQLRGPVDPCQKTGDEVRALDGMAKWVIHTRRTGQLVGKLGTARQRVGTPRDRRRRQRARCPGSPTLSAAGACGWRGRL